MNKKIGRMTIIICLVLAIVCQNFAVFAEVTLPEGTVAGLPEKLSVMDSDGNSVSSSTGEYFFLVEGMKPLVDYSKDIQITNLRDDKSYHIYFYAEPLDKEGEIDLETYSTATFTLEGKEIFTGKVTGESADGLTDIKNEPVDLGLYRPGDSRKMNCTISWDGTIGDYFIDNGYRVVDIDGEHVIREKEGKEYISGQVRFRWIFYAVVDEDTPPPKTGIIGTAMTYYVAIIMLMAAAIIVMFVLVKKKRKES